MVQQFYLLERQLAKTKTISILLPPFSTTILSPPYFTPTIQANEFILGLKKWACAQLLPIIKISCVYIYNSFNFEISHVLNIILLLRSIDFTGIYAGSKYKTV